MNLELWFLFHYTFGDSFSFLIDLKPVIDELLVVLIVWQTRVVRQIVSAYLTPWVWGVIVSLVKFAFAFGNNKFPVVLLIFRAIKKPVYRCKSYDMITRWVYLLIKKRVTIKFITLMTVPVVRRAKGKQLCYLVNLPGPILILRWIKILYVCLESNASVFWILFWGYILLFVY